MSQRNLPQRDFQPLSQTAAWNAMPSLFRFLLVLAVVAAIGGAAMLYLANYVEPNPREMSVRVPAERLAP